MFRAILALLWPIKQYAILMKYIHVPYARETFAVKTGLLKYKFIKFTIEI